jgi:uncharacterized protein (TIGR03437 family)
MIHVRHAVFLSAVALLSPWLAMAADNLSVNKTSVDLGTAGAGSTTKVSDSSVTLTNSGTTGVKFNFNISYQAGQMGGWLSASGNPATIGANGATSTITITGDPRKLPPNDYTGFIVITGNNSQTQKITVSFSTQGTTLSASPFPSIDFPSGPPGTNHQLVTMKSPGANVAIAVSMNNGTGWLSTDSGPEVDFNTSATYNVNVNTSALAAGTYTGTVVMQYSGSGAPFVEVDIAVSVSIPALTASAGSPLTFTADAGTAPNGQSITLTNYTSSPAPVTITTAGDSWLGAPSVSPTTIPANGGKSTVGVLVTSQLLLPSTVPYQSSFSIQTPAGGFNYNVSVTVNGVIPAIVTALPATINASAGQKITNTLQVDSKGATLNITVNSQPTTWLSYTTTAPGTYQVTADATGLTTGSHSGNLQISCVGKPACVAVNIPLSLNVTGPGLTTTSLQAFQAYTGRQNPPSQSLSVTSSDNLSSIGFNITNIPTWLKVSPTSGTASSKAATLTVTANPAGLNASVSGSFTITPTNGAGATNIPVQLNLSPFSISAGAITLSLPPGATKSDVLAVSTADGNPATVQATASSTGNWLSVSNSVSAPGNLSYSVNAAGLVANNYTGTITLTCATGNTCAAVPVQVSLTVTQSSVAINQVLNNTGEAAVISQNTWVEIKGTNLAQTTRIWGGNDFVNNNMPTTLDGVSATVNGKAAYIYYVSPTQVNILTPLDTATGSVPVQLKSPLGTSGIVNTTMQAISPGFFTFSNSTVIGRYPAALHGNGDCVNPNNGTCYVGPTNLFPGLTTPVKPGEFIVLYANGFGPTDTAIVAGAVTQSGSLSPKPVVTIGGLQCNVIFAGLTSVGEFQFNVTVPVGVPDGDNLLVATYNGASTQPGVYIPIQH